MKKLDLDLRPGYGTSRKRSSGSLGSFPALSKDDPTLDGQKVEVEHTGPDGTQVMNIQVVFGDGDSFSMLRCWEHGTEGGLIPLPDGANRRVILVCTTVYTLT